ncbi:succinylglutamate desuccinylase / aspartoacylase family protein [Methanobrevibacter cuticularis]|uniref:Succinylglutamate desuccinylase / aspartoacylase family protein n=1 Tax=Methanobrevibacter cuticularis TaxID=47311 RepID=A0A166CJG0_9EURY|nr:succinylglutamate desuccinylase/aspartoacylase family protein [Methanobrevibacter cuticularis]KZX14827.1 succinylglutamate desuccinylase / aspartoacylase family protein [Methanobrevibacter cuticularis]
MFTEIYKKKRFFLFLIILVVILAIGVISSVNAVTSSNNDNNEINSSSNFTISYFDKNVGGNVLKNSKISKNIPKGELSRKIVQMSKKGSVILKLGTGKPKILISAGIHGNEPGANIATLRFIERIKNKKIKGSIYIIPFVIPKDTALNRRTWYNPKTKKLVDPNRVSNIKGTPGYKLVQFAKKNKIKNIIEVHTGGFISNYKRGFIWANKYPLKGEKAWLNYINKNVNPKIGYGAATSGMVRGYSRANGLPTITLEVERDKGPFSKWIDVEYKMLVFASKFFKIF